MKNTEFENKQVLNLIQAMVGSITPNIRRISLECVENCIKLYFLIAQENAADREEIEDILFEFEALQDSFVDVQVSAIVSSGIINSLELPGRLVFGRKE